MSGWDQRGDIEDYSNEVAGDEEPIARGWYGLSCWNALSKGQQERLIEWGNLPIFSLAEGVGCRNAAEVAVETQSDVSPGPRFYCLGCAIKYLEARP